MDLQAQFTQMRPVDLLLDLPEGKVWAEEFIGLILVLFSDKELHTKAYRFLGSLLCQSVGLRDVLMQRPVAWAKVDDLPLLIQKRCNTTIFSSTCTLLRAFHQLLKRSGKEMADS
ncbi:hypothetical protein ACJX0J_026445, partial [Zea mays]